VKFTSLNEIKKKKAIILDYIQQAIAIEESGKKVIFAKEQEPIPNELLDMFSQHPRLKTAFESLTPGRRRGYLLHFNQAKQSATKVSRINACMSKILSGKGLNE
jgi:uncharacterized protein YdeI (YjbR/CyaY-like superfamily)